MQEFIVSTFEDENDGDFSEGDLSLREAIALANEAEGEDTIIVEDNLDSAILVNAGPESNLVINDSVSIIAAGENQQRIVGISVFEVAENVDVEIANFDFLGGQIDNSGNLNISNSTFNSANDTAIVSRGMLDLQNVLVQRSGGEQSGVLIESGTAEISESAIINNEVSFEGTSGLTINEGAEVFVSNSTIANNRNFRDGSAAGIINAGSLSVSNSTIVDNNGGEGAGGIANSGEATVTSTIVADNTGGANVGDISGEGEFTSGGFNLVGNGDDVSGFLESDIVGTVDNPINPLLRPLEINGVSSNFALRELSPAIDNGSNPDDLTTDQRGLPRVSGEATDIGAVERQIVVEDENNSPQTITVSILEDEDDGDISDGDLSLREAIALAESGDTITFNSSLSGGTINLSLGELLIDKSLTIQGLGADQLTIDANETSRVFRIDDGNFDNDLDVSIEGITITGGMIGFSFSSRFGGGIFTTENLELTNSLVSGNAANFRGGGIYSSGDRLTIDNSTISDNRAFAGPSRSIVSYGGGIATVGTTVEITGSSITGNFAAARGGGGLNFQDSQATIADSTIADNDGAGAGGINLDNSEVNINRSIITGNSTSFFGGSGAINSDANSVLTIDRSIIDGNSGIDPFDPYPQRGSQAFAAGIGVRGTTTITNSTISNSIVERIDDPIPPDNPRASVPQLPTGFGVRNTGDLTIINSTFSGNPDAGISNEGGTVNISNTTLADGLANVDLTADDNSATVISTIVVDDSQELEVAIDENSNLIGNSEDLLLGELQDNGGFAPTVALLDGSPAIDAGSNLSELDFDQRGLGFDRTEGDGTDIGAFELQAIVTPNVNEIVGTERGDVLDGTQESDRILGLNANDTIRALGGDDTIEGGNGNDSLEGGTGNDLIDGGAGFDSLFGGTGNDTLDAGNGNDSIDGGAGNDFLIGLGGRDTLLGGDGADTSQGGAGVDSIEGGAGNDQLFGGTDNDSLFGGAGNDLIDGGRGNDSLRGDDGDDIFVLASGNGTDTIADFDRGNNLLRLFSGISFADLTFSGNNIILGDETLAILNGFDATSLTQSNFITDMGEPEMSQENEGDGSNEPTESEVDGNESIDSEGDGSNEVGGNQPIENPGGGSESIDSEGDGSNEVDGNEPIENPGGGSEAANPLLNGDDVINGTNADDVLLGGEGNNILFGFEGNDRLEAGSGNDTLDANTGDDTLIGGDGNNILFGFDGNDVLQAGSGDDTLDAGNGDDTIGAGGGNDIITAGSGLDIINAGDGSDTIDGGSDADAINAGNGDDLINGNIGNDTLTGAAGDDTLIGGAGDDLIIGSGGSDLFVLDAQGGANTIQDFDASLDTIGLADADDITFDELTITGSSTAAIAFEGETIGIITNISASDLTADNFVIYEID